MRTLVLLLTLAIAPALLAQDRIVVKMDRVGDPSKIVSGTTRVTNLTDASLPSANRGRNLRNVSYASSCMYKTRETDIITETYNIM